MVTFTSDNGIKKKYKYGSDEQVCIKTLHIIFYFYRYGKMSISIHHSNFSLVRMRKINFKIVCSKETEEVH